MKKGFYLCFVGMCQGCVKGVSRVCQACVKRVSRVCRRNLEQRLLLVLCWDVSRVCQACVKRVSRVCQEYVEGTLNKGFYLCFVGMLRVKNIHNVRGKNLVSGV